MSKVGQLLQKLGSFLSNLFKNTVKELDTVILPAAIAVTNALKTVLDGDTADIIGTLAGAAGKTLEDKIRAILDTITPKLQLAQQFLASGNDPAAILADVIKLIGTAPAETKTAFFVEFSGLVANALADGQLTLDEAIQLAQYFYHNYDTPTAESVNAAVATSQAATAGKG